MNFRRLLDIRENADLTQFEMAKILMTSQSNYSRWENGSEIIPLKKLNLFCNHFGYSMDYVLGLSKNNKNCHKIKLDSIIVGKNFKKFRKENKITQVEIASLLNTSQSTISAYESGDTLILTAFIYQIAVTYNISIDYLVGRSSIKYIKEVISSSY